MNTRTFDVTEERPVHATQTEGRAPTSDELEDEGANPYDVLIAEADLPAEMRQVVDRRLIETYGARPTTGLSAPRT